MMRRALKFIHVMAAAGLLGAMAALLILSSAAPPAASTAGYAAVRAAMGVVSTWLFLPSLGLSIMAGLLAVAVNRAFHNAGWAWAKLVSGVLLFEGGLQGIQGPIQNEAERSAAVLAGHADPAALAVSLGAERGTLWVLFAVAVANVVLGIWRPKLTSIPD